MLTDAIGHLFQIKAHIKLVRACGGPQHAEALMNALRYTTTHGNDPATPKSVRELLMMPPGQQS